MDTSYLYKIKRIRTKRRSQLRTLRVLRREDSALSRKMNIETPQDRENALRKISPEDALSFHALINQIFEYEIEYRTDDSDYDFYENLYWCGLLLYCVGDANDIERMWKAKHINMDTARGFDVQYLVAGGVTKTKDFLIQKGRHDIVDYLKSCEEAGDFDDLEEWKKSKIQYFYDA